MEKTKSLSCEKDFHASLNSKTLEKPLILLTKSTVNQNQADDKNMNGLGRRLKINHKFIMIDFTYIVLHFTALKTTKQGIRLCFVLATIGSGV